MFIYIHILSYYKLFLYFNLYLSKMLDSLLCSFTSISFITTSCSFNVCLSVTLNSVSCSFTSISFITNMNTGCIDLFWYVYDFYWSFVNSYVNTVYIKTDFHFSVVILSNRNIQSGCHVYRVEPKLQLLQRSMYKHYGGLRTNRTFSQMTLSCLTLYLSTAYIWSTVKWIIVIFHVHFFETCLVIFVM